MAVTLKLERGVKTLDQLFAEADDPAVYRKFEKALQGRTGAQLVRDLRRDLEKKYPGDALFEFYSEP